MNILLYLRLNYWMAFITLFMRLKVLRDCSSFLMFELGNRFDLYKRASSRGISLGGYGITGGNEENS